MSNQIFFPVIIDLEVEDTFKFKFDNGCFLRKILPGDREKLFGIKEVDYCFSSVRLPGRIGFNKIEVSDKRGVYDFKKWFSKDLSGSDDIFASNYLIVVESDKYPSASQIDRINLAFKLFRPTSTGIWLGFDQKDPGAVHFHHPSPLAGVYPYAKISKQNLKTIRDNYKLLNKALNQALNQLNKYEVLKELYTESLTGKDIKTEMKFLMIIIALEILYLDGEKNELNFKFCIRSANILTKYRKENAKQIYELMKKIYSARSDIAHSGKSSKLKWELFNSAVEITRISFLLYLENKDIFSLENINNVCLIES